MAPRVSVIIPAFNGEAFLAEAVESALAQTYAPSEIIVLDDGSTDGTPELARQLPVTYIRQENAGVSAARNAAIARSSGDLLALLDADDVWTPEKTAIQVQALEDNPGAGYAVSYYSHFFEAAGGPPAWFPPPWYRDRPVPDKEAGHCIPSTWMIRREVWDTVGPFDVTKRIGEDIDWLARAKDIDVRTVLVNEVLVHKRAHETNLTAGATEGGPGLWLETIRRSLTRRKERAGS